MIQYPVKVKSPLQKRFTSIIFACLVIRHR